MADAFEAMTAARPYRMTPLTNEQAMAELRKFAGIQFDPEVVDAFARTHWAAGINDPGREPPSPRPPVPLLSQAATPDGPRRAVGRSARIAARQHASGRQRTDPSTPRPDTIPGCSSRDRPRADRRARSPAARLDNLARGPAALDPA